MRFRGLSIAAIVLTFGACGGRDAPTSVLQRFYDAAIAGDEETARGLLVERGNNAGIPSGWLEPRTRGGELEGIEILDVNVWSEQRANARVRKHFSDGTSKELRIELEGHGGRWRILSPVSEL